MRYLVPPVGLIASVRIVRAESSSLGSGARCRGPAGPKKAQVQSVGCVSQVRRYNAPPATRHGLTPGGLHRMRICATGLPGFLEAVLTAVDAEILDRNQVDSSNRRHRPGASPK